jgi:hypothetical protein
MSMDCMCISSLAPLDYVLEAACWLLAQDRGQLTSIGHFLDHYGRSCRESSCTEECSMSWRRSKSRDPPRKNRRRRCRSRQVATGHDQQALTGSPSISLLLPSDLLVGCLPPWSGLECLLPPELGRRDPALPERLAPGVGQAWAPRPWAPLP